MRSNTGMANREGDVDLRKAQVSPPPPQVRTLAWLCGNDVIRSTASSPAEKDSPMICMFNVVPYDRLRNKITDTRVDFTSSPLSRNRYHTG